MRALLRRIAIASSVTLAAPTLQAATDSQTPPTTADQAKATVATPNLLDRLSDFGLEIRKSFDGTVKEQGLPATISYVDSDLSGTFYAVDLAIKLTSWECSRGETTLLVFPVAEWHRSTASGEEKNKASAGLNIEYFFGAPFVLLTGKWSRDFLKDQSSGQVGLMASLSGVKRLSPGTPIRNAAGSFRARYYPYLGLEHFDNLPVKRGEVVLASDVAATFATARLFVEWHPFNPTPGPGRLQIIATYAHRREIGGDALDDSYDLFNLGLAYYLDPKQRIALGYDYERGEDPAANFLTNEKVSMSLKVKL